MIDKLFDGSDAHLLPGNAELIEPPHEIICYALKVGDWFKERDITHWKIADCASRNALEAADKRIAEEREAYDRLLEEGANKLHEAERKLDVAREALYGWIDYNFHHHCWPDNFNKTQAALNLIGREALAQIGGDDEQT